MLHHNNPELSIMSIPIDNHDSQCRKNTQSFYRMSTNRNRNQTMNNQQQQPAMHRKSISKCKFSKSHYLNEKTKSEKSNLVKMSQSFPAKKRLKPRNSRNKDRKRSLSVVRSKNMIIPLPTLGTTSFVTLLTLICMETVLLSTMSSCAKTFYMHWNTSNSIFRIDNTDHIIDVNKGNLAFEFDQVHIICPVYEPGTFENETEKYIIYNVSKVEYETCRITNADPRVIAICDKPQKLMFFTITFRPFTPQPGGLEFLPGNDYYFISTSSKDDLYRRIGGRCSTNNMKVVFKVCCAANEDKNKTSSVATSSVDVAGAGSGADNAGNSVNVAANNEESHHGHGMVHGNNIAMGNSGGLMPAGNPINPTGIGIATTINSNIDQFNRIPIQQPNIVGNNVGSSGIILTPGNPNHGLGSINMLQPGRGGINIAYPGQHHHIQTGIRINNVPTQHNNNYPLLNKGIINSNGNNNDDHNHYNKQHPNEVVKNEELTYNSGGSCQSLWINSTLVLCIIAFLTINYMVETTFARPACCALETTLLNMNL
ncbi:hybrid signal transduction histidine kinase E isoform X2 [Drosophila kikkawai]|uniref:Hybrid signal transduction histidine kinase E isoform X2 n=1 Tax=Drosophila kikkawai TaxID=30033 RepID=A0ABM3C7H4_DROKI|nr:uncharacterized protein LOC108085207 [Drosophila kikkawai]